MILTYSKKYRGMLYLTTAEYIFFSNGMEHYPKLTTCWGIKQMKTNVKGLKSYQVCSLTMVKLR